MITDLDDVDSSCNSYEETKGEQLKSNDSEVIFIDTHAPGATVIEDVDGVDGDDAYPHKPPRRATTSGGGGGQLSAYNPKATTSFLDSIKQNIREEDDSAVSFGDKAPSLSLSPLRRRRLRCRRLRRRCVLLQSTEMHVYVCFICSR